MSRDAEKDSDRIPKDHVPWAEATAILGGSSSGIVFVILGISALGTELTIHGVGLIGAGVLCALIPTAGVIWNRFRD